MAPLTFWPSLRDDCISSKDHDEAKQLLRRVWLRRCQRGKHAAAKGNEPGEKKNFCTVMPLLAGEQSHLQRKSACKQQAPTSTSNEPAQGAAKRGVKNPERAAPRLHVALQCAATHGTT